MIKQRLLFFFRAFERLATYSNGLVQYQVSGFSTLIDRTNLSLQQSSDELHANELVKQEMPTEQQLKELCDLITAGVGSRASAQKISDLEA